VTEKQKRILKNVGKLAIYTTLTGGAYLLAKGTLSILLKQLEPKEEAPKCDSNWENTRHNSQSAKPDRATMAGE
jgi:hypothetical protein